MVTNYNQAKIHSLVVEVDLNIIMSFLLLSQPVVQALKLLPLLRLLAIMILLTLGSVFKLMVKEKVTATMLCLL